MSLRSSQLPRNGSHRPLRCRLTQLWRTLLPIGVMLPMGLVGCHRNEPAAAPAESPRASIQEIVDNSTRALVHLRQSDHRAEFEACLTKAKAVLVFPRVIKASFVFGGEGGSGVLTARRADGSWSDPAFYSIGGPSVGLQIGYQEATMVLFIMDEPTLERMLYSTVELGTKSGVTLGVASERDTTTGEIVNRNICQVTEADGAFAGISLDGYVIGARTNHNAAYYDRNSTPYWILKENHALNPAAEPLRKTLATAPPKV